MSSSSRITAKSYDITDFGAIFDNKELVYLHMCLCASVFCASVEAPVTKDNDEQNFSTPVRARR